MNREVQRNRDDYGGSVAHCGAICQSSALRVELHDSRDCCNGGGGGLVLCVAFVRAVLCARNAMTRAMATMDAMLCSASLCARAALCARRLVTLAMATAVAVGAARCADGVFSTSFGQRIQ